VTSNGNQDGIVWVSYPQLDGQWQKAPGYGAGTRTAGTCHAAILEAGVIRQLMVAPDPLVGGGGPVNGVGGWRASSRAMFRRPA
jgi:hypothetical protein